MKFTKTVPYSLKQIAAIAGLAIAPFFIQSCNHEPDAPTPRPAPIKSPDIELVFNRLDTLPIELDTIRKYASDTSVRYIYLVPANNGWGFGTAGTLTITRFRKLLQRRIDIAPDKVRGRGAFQFLPFEPAQVPMDSLWYVQNGWLINNQRSYTR